MEEELLQWDELFSVNNLVLDKQHQQLFEYVNKLYQAIIKKEAHLYIAQTVSDLFNYSKEHFDTEEAMMEQTFFPEREAHKRYHRYFIDEIKFFKSTIIIGKQEINSTVLDFAADWLRMHVLGEDRKFAKHLKDLLK
ncbi:MAG: hemerythrin family protein [Bacteroidales bacterium]|nr:hemerythrin family protein [Bacteroidales bacterium]